MEAFQLGHDPEHLSIVTVPHPDDPSRYDEIDRLGITFEDMQHTIAGNLKSIVNLSVNEERLKYQLLQSQINPHFLYNILGSIRTCQSLGKLDIADQMIADLTAFYRLTLRKFPDLQDYTSAISRKFHSARDFFGHTSCFHFYPCSLWR